MSSQVVKGVAAGIVVILVMTGLLLVGEKGQGVALGKVVESMHMKPWVHVKATIHRGDQIEVREEWECYNPKVHTWKDPNGVIHFRDYSRVTAYVYQPASRTVTISSTTDQFNQRGPQSPAEAVQDMIAQFEYKGSRVIRENITRGHVPVEVISMKDEHQEIALVVDLDQQVPLSMDAIAHLPDTGQEVHMSAEFDYPVQGPSDIYSLGVPEDAQVVDHRPKGSVQDLIGKVQSRFDAGYPDHMAVVLDSWVGDNNELEPAQIMVMRQKDKMKRVDRYHAYHFTGSRSDWPTLYPLIKDAWPNLTIQEVAGFEDNQYAEFQLIYDGMNSTQRTNFSGQVTVHTLRTDLFLTGEIESLASLAWCNPSALLMSGQDQQIEPESCPDDPNRPGWIGFRLKASMHDPDKRLPGTTIKQRITDYWFDPARDYLLMERRTVEQADEGDRSFVIRIRQPAQTSTGQWYPEVILTKSSYPDSRGRMTHHCQERRIQVDTEPVFNDSVFDKATIGG